MKSIRKIITEIVRDSHFWGSLWRYSLLIAVIIVLDQWSKLLIQKHFVLGEILPVLPGFFNLTQIHNPGAAFGFMAEAGESIRRPLFLFIPVVACLWLVFLIWQSRKNNILLGIAYSLIFAGAIGNLIDRFTMGYVVDFLQFYWRHYYFPSFNVADSSITIAAGLLIIDFIKNIKASKKMPASERADHETDPV
ncbi:MAG: signal peptidase II [Pseudomonadota bacterium]